MVFGVFSSGYLSRPIGALLFGYIGDKKGRSHALSKTIQISTFATCAIGLIPSYDNIGILAPLLLITFRLLQGIAVSGEEGGAVVLLFERSSFRNQYLISGAVLSSVLLGVILGNIICVITDITTNREILPSWGWRLPFIIALPLGIISFRLRTYLNDYESFNLAIENNLILKIPMKTLLTNYFWIVIYGFLVASIYSITTSTLIVYIPYYLTNNLGYSHYVSLCFLMFAIILIVLFTLLIGKIIDKKNSINIYKIGMIGFTILAPFLFYILSFGCIAATICSILIFSVIISLISSTVFSILVGIFPFNVRYSGVSLAFNLAITIFSSTTPLALIYFQNVVSNRFAPGIYLSVITFLLFHIIVVLSKKVSIFCCYQNESESYIYSS